MLERDWWQMGLRVAGLDEAGRGALAGPVTAAAVVLPPCLEGYPFRDSKTLSPPQRAALAQEIRQVALAWGVGWAEATEIDRLGILKATYLAATRALAQLGLRPQALLTDYLRWQAEWQPYLEASFLFRAPPKADQNSPSVAAASILAKVARDEHMRQLEQQYPGYGFAQHKGYGTPAHLKALEELGPCPQHRRSFAPLIQRPLLSLS
ncbi:ribonuclease HII [Meiothermus rufus]|uniref:ribonuclease HII n=1 Tax=Meiothermus rufus TaxID=604332 RepID=UPI0003FDDBD3|nr:ribonuclease HII [Meiothermus rufus]